MNLIGERIMATRRSLVWERSDKPFGGGPVADNFCLIDIQKRAELIREKKSTPIMVVKQKIRKHCRC